MNEQYKCWRCKEVQEVDDSDGYITEPRYPDDKVGHRVWQPDGIKFRGTIRDDEWSNAEWRCECGAWNVFRLSASRLLDLKERAKLQRERVRQAQGRRNLNKGGRR